MFSIIGDFKFIVDESNHSSLIYHFGDWSDFPLFHKSHIIPLLRLSKLDI